MLAICSFLVTCTAGSTFSGSLRVKYIDSTCKEIEEIPLSAVHEFDKGEAAPK